MRLATGIILAMIAMVVATVLINGGDVVAFIKWLGY